MPTTAAGGPAALTPPRRQGGDGGSLRQRCWDAYPGSEPGPALARILIGASPEGALAAPARYPHAGPRLRAWRRSGRRACHRFARAHWGNNAEDYALYH